MPLQQTQAEDAVPVQSVVTQQQPQDAPPRYDAKTVQQIIALAEKLQTHHRETLTPDDIENLGREIGVDPEFIRRALAQVQTHPATYSAPTRPKRVVKIPRRVLTRRQGTVAMIPAAFYLLLSPFTFGWFTDAVPTSHETNGLIGLFVALPALLAFCVGINGKNKRLGALGGGSIGLAAFVSMMAFGVFHHWHQTPLHQTLTVLEIWLASGLTLGVVGAALRQILSEPFPRKRLRVRLVVEPMENKETGDWV